MPLPLRIRQLVLLVAGMVAAAPGAAAFEWTGLRPIGAVEAVDRNPDGVALRCVGGDRVVIRVLAPDLVRVRTLFSGQAAAPDHSWAIAKTDWPTPSWNLKATPSDVLVSTAELQVDIQRRPLLIAFRDPVTGRTINADERPMGRDPATGRVAVAKVLGFDEHFYGLGEKAAPLDRRRGAFTMWNSDTPGYGEGTDPLYQSIPFYLGWEDGRAYGLFYDNSFRSAFDFGHTQQRYAGYEAAGGEINYYFFRGPSMKRILNRYTQLTGRMPMPPLWALGNQQCRYSYYPDSMVKEVVRQYRARDLPLDVVYLDIHYMDGYRVFTWNSRRFPDPAGLTRWLRGQGVRLVTIVDPGVKYEPRLPGATPTAGAAPWIGSHARDYYVYDQGLAQGYFLRRADGRLYIGRVWPGQAVFVDYTRADARQWWGGLHRALVDEGVSGIWNDMNEPSDFVDKSGVTQRDVEFDDLGAHTPYDENRNVFALNMDRATFHGLERLRPGRRPFVITRAGYAGVQRYAVMWTGDNTATFASLALNVPMFTSLGLSGESFVGADLPGFIGRGDGELLARSYELAFLVPLCRNHAAIDSYDHEPWRYGAPYEDIVRRYLKLRYRLLPFLYTTLEEAHRTGVPLLRPLLLEFQDDPTTLDLDDELMVGDALLAAPVTQRGLRSREVYLPRGRWYDFWTGAAVDGPAYFEAAAPLDRIPLYVRGGSIVPSTAAMDHTGERAWDPIRFDIYPDASGRASGSLYEDDGESTAYASGVWRRTRVDYAREGAAAGITVEAPQGPYRPGPRTFAFVVHGGAGAARTLRLTDDSQAHRLPAP